MASTDLCVCPQNSGELRVGKDWFTNIMRRREEEKRRKKWDYQLWGKL